MDKPKKATVTRVVMLGDSLTQSGGIATIQNLMLKHAPANIRIQHIASHDEGSAFLRIVVFSKALGRLLWALIWHRIDIVHVHISDGGSIVRKTIIALIAFLFRKPVVMHANGSVFHLNYAKMSPLLQRGFRWVFQRCAAFLPVTTYWRDYYTTQLGLAKHQVVVLPNPAELPDQIPDRRHARPVKFVFCGRLGKRKGAFDCIQAFADMPAHLRQQAELWMAGDGEVEQARQMVAQLQLTEQVKLLGWIGTAERDRLLEQADVFVLPTNNEGLPLALIEAMCYGLPVLTTPSSGISDIVTSGKNGLLVMPGDIAAISAAMQQLVADEPLRLAMGKAGRTMAAALDVKSFWANLAEIYTTVLTPDRRPQRVEKIPAEALD
jgi:glycosyltransferase involved in cell wall biosynthesis